MTTMVQRLRGAMAGTGNAHGSMRTARRLSSLADGAQEGESASLRAAVAFAVQRRHRRWAGKFVSKAREN